MNLMLVYDDLDTRRGEYFTASHQDLINRLLPENITRLQSLNTNHCLEKSVDFYTPVFDGQPFVFVAYTHGSKNAVCISNEDYIHANNAYLFNKTLFYACCCLLAQSLGQQLIANGCTVFIGFDATIKSGRPETEGIFQECENTFIEHFLNTESTIANCMVKMYEKYRAMEHHLSRYYSTFEGSTLMDNLNAFQLLCREDVYEFTKRNFI
jgi:hypothetical protein